MAIDINDIVPTPIQYGDLSVRLGVQIERYGVGDRIIAINVDGVCALRLVLDKDATVETNNLRARRL